MLTAKDPHEELVILFGALEPTPAPPAATLTQTVESLREELLGRINKQESDIVELKSDIAKHESDIAK